MHFFPSRIAGLCLLVALTGCPRRAKNAPATEPREAASSEAEGANAAPSEGEPAAPTAPKSKGTSTTDSMASRAAVVHGTVTQAGKSFEVKGALALWKPSDPGVTFVLLPFVPTPAEVEEIRKARTFFMMLEKGNSLPGFPDRTPFAKFSVKWPFDKEAVGAMDKAHCAMYVNNLGKKGNNTNLSWGADKQSMKLIGKLEVGQRVSLESKREDEIMGEKTSWDLSFQGEIQALID